MKLRKQSISDEKLSNLKLKKKVNFNEKKKKTVEIQNVNKSISKHSRRSKTHSSITGDEIAALVVHMDCSTHPCVPSLLKNTGHQEMITSSGYNVQRLSDLVTPVNFKKQKSQISRLPCSYKQQKKENLLNLASSKFKPVTENSFQKHVTVDGMEFHILSGSEVMLIMTPPTLLYFNGSFKIHALMGGVEVLGFLINSGSGAQTLYSTNGASHTCLKPVIVIESLKHKDFITEKSDVERYLGLKIKDEDKIEIISKLNENSVVLILQKNKDLLYSEIWPKLFFRYCSSYNTFAKNFLNEKERMFSVIENVLNCLFEVSSNYIAPKKYKELAQWSALENDILYKNIQEVIAPRTVLVGGKSVGKSTLLRYMVNKSLKNWNRVLVLDFDIGQSEFTVPGCVSAVLVQTPLLGTNFTHLMDPIRSVFVGDIDAVKCLETYMEGCQQVINYCRSQYVLEYIPWFVNTMGFCKALGYSITTSIIQKVSPKYVVQIYSKSKSRNFEQKLTPQLVNQERFGKYTRRFNELDYTLCYIPSASEEKGGSNTEWGMPPKQARQLVLFSYLSQMLTSEAMSFLQIKPYMVNISKLYFEVQEATMSPHQAVAVMNGNLVALCNKSKNCHQFPNCLGFGIVRGVDYNTGQLFLITPLKLKKLQDVNCLVKGNLSLPDSLFLELEDTVESHVPYVSFTSDSPTSKLAKREYNPNKSTAGTYIKDY